jgi:hypothetical protein
LILFAAAPKKDEVVKCGIARLQKTKKGRISWKVMQLVQRKQETLKMELEKVELNRDL